jgi:predicted HAD superfamily hydrolase
MTQQREINAKNGAVSKMRSSRIISFDIFDTLLGRIVASPMDVFRLMVDDIGGVVGYSVPDFVNIRRHAEKAANTIARQEHDKEDVTLAEIYAQLGTMLSLSDEQIAQAMDVEMKWERACLVPRAAGQYLWQRARKLHKDIILVSDMYLPKEFLESVLRDNGYDGWTKFYLSADYGQTKRSGLLFKHPLADFKAEPENIVHIGDNAVGDISVPKAMGIKTIHIPRTVEILKNVTPFTGKVHTSLIAKGRTLSTSIVSQTIADRMFSGIDDKPTSVFKDDPFEFGYATLGPLVAGFIRWIQTEV